MRLPDFLIIGAMKAGTTGLYRDLLTNPRVYFPYKKEPHALTSDDVLSDAGLRQYADLFAGAESDQICGEASTGYTKLPDFPGVPERAAKVLGDRFKVIYLVRNPVDRIVSHYRHVRWDNESFPPIDEQVREDPRYVNYSRYAMQAAPWLDAIGPDRVRIVLFERYAEDRTGVVTELCEFLGIPPRPELVETDKVYNRSDGKPVARGVLGALRNNTLYRDYLRKAVPMPIRDAARQMFLPKVNAPPPKPSPETVQWIVDQTRDDARRLASIMGEPHPLWDIHEHPGGEHAEPPAAHARLNETESHRHTA